MRKKPVRQSPKEEVKAVELMRRIREKLSTTYRANPEQEEQDLDRIRKKYHIQKSKEV
ncbi:MAG TPA: hypothetical protein VKA68_15470 [bacterium]|nr:hypothetical protein [bacterium]